MESASRILIVDDERVVLNVCRRSLENLPYHVELAENGSQALQKLHHSTFDIVFSDLKMPIMDGVELLDAIKRDYPYTEVVIMTGFATIQGAIESMKKGASDFILKPIKPDQIRLAVSKCLEKIELGEQNRILRLANQKLIELQDMKDKFVAITSHEIRTPLSHLKGYLDILLNHQLSRQLSKKEKQQCMEVIQTAVKDLEEIVGKMHDLSQLENNELRGSTEPIEVNTLIEKVVGNYKLLARSRNQTLQFEQPFDNGSLQILGNRRQILSALNELIQNAVKFTPDKGKITVRTTKEGNFCVIGIKDTGIGIDPTEHGKIFDKFYEVQDSRYHTSSKNAFLGGGLGLGLPAAQSVATAHGGGIKVISEREQGAEFLFYLPLAEHDSEHDR